jgi:hypothetical protein
MNRPQIVLFLTLILVISNCMATYGGNDIFTSLQAMKELWLEERQFVNKLEETIDNFQDILNGMKR